MACINVHTEDTHESCLSLSVTRVCGGGINVHINHATPPLHVSTIDSIKKHLNVRTSIVCSLSEVVDFLRVTPAEIQWITDDMGVFYDVESNVDWIIVTS